MKISFEELTYIALTFTAITFLIIGIFSVLVFNTKVFLYIANPFFILEVVITLYFVSKKFINNSTYTYKAYEIFIMLILSAINYTAIFKMITLF
ncbi:hypothetical protein [Caminibacter pacificus]|uniref:Uncharacterized protein n=1 Tax=Caminibacter pacificus TaxID=1424653 RepID=A0AAJ4RB44_9BACT|nr:hypothetical protein [Caminibacter pacificus]QDD68133.1 hypothetical protein C6V80_09780 [Caminibacter pacificus]ROR38751.1 hypothetical protein EDC58_1966 [Caminibacter pacificus]